MQKDCVTAWYCTSAGEPDVTLPDVSSRFMGYLESPLNPENVDSGFGSYRRNYEAITVPINNERSLDKRQGALVFPRCSQFDSLDDGQSISLFISR
jgi:hypothetical protein